MSDGLSLDVHTRYEVIPFSIADKIRQRKEKHVIIFESTAEKLNDEYADYEIPDDLMW